MVLGKFPVPGGLLIWIRVVQGPTALAVGAGGRCLDNFLSSIISQLPYRLQRVNYEEKCQNIYSLYLALKDPSMQIDGAG